MSALQVVVRDPRTQMVDVMEPDIAGEEAQEPRELQVGAALERRLVVVPLLVCLPVGVLELMLDVEEPDPGAARQDQRQPLDEQEPLPPEQPPERGADEHERKIGAEDASQDAAGGEGA